MVASRPVAAETTGVVSQNVSVKGMFERSSLVAHLLLSLDHECEMWCGIGTVGKVGDESKSVELSVKATPKESGRECNCVISTTAAAASPTRCGDKRCTTVPKPRGERLSATGQCRRVPSPG